MRPQIIANTVEELRTALRNYISEMEAVQAKYVFKQSALEFMSPADIRDMLQNGEQLAKEHPEHGEYYKYPMSDFTEVKGMNKFVGLYHFPTGQRILPI